MRRVEFARVVKLGREAVCRIAALAVEIIEDVF
jgi:hypothetical protein